jgi:hypothetical protein
MKARGVFKVHRVLDVDKRRVGAEGEVVKGVVRTGMRIQPLQVGAKLARLRIKGVEAIDYLSEGRSTVVLLFDQCTSAELQDALPYDRLILVEPAW